MKKIYEIPECEIVKFNFADEIGRATRLNSSHA